MTQTAKALLVDDRRENLMALEAILQGLPVQSVAVESGEAALKQLLVDDFAVILLDAQMPDMDGFETASHIKRRERTRHVPIIFLTAADRDAQLALRGYAVGAVDYLTKPFDPWVLRAKVSVFVELWVKTRQLAAQSDVVRERETPVAARSPTRSTRRPPCCGRRRPGARRPRGGPAGAGPLGQHPLNAAVSHATPTRRAGYRVGAGSPWPVAARRARQRSPSESSSSWTKSEEVAHLGDPLTGRGVPAVQRVEPAVGDVDEVLVEAGLGDGRLVPGLSGIR